MYRVSDSVKFSEMDTEGRMKLAAVMDAMQNCSDEQSEALGIGYEWLRARNRGWVLLYWHVVIDRYPARREAYTVETRPWRFEHFQGHRNFALYDAQENRIVSANSRWCFLDTEKMRPVRPEACEIGPYGVDPRLDMDYPKERRIPLPQEMTDGVPFAVTKDQLDLNGHVNNVRYIEMAERLMPRDFVTAELKVEYRTAAAWGDVICPAVGERDGWQVVSLNDTNGSPYAIVALKRKTDSDAG